MRKFLVASFVGLLKVRTFFPNQKKMAFRVKLQLSFGPKIDLIKPKLSQLSQK